MAQSVTVGNETFKKRNIFAAWIGLPLITLGIYSVVWYYKINNEARRYLRDPSISPLMSVLAVTLGWVIIVPPFISIYNTGKRIRRMEEAATLPVQTEPWVGFLLMFVASTYVLYYQMHLNNLWDAYTPRAMPQPAGAPLPPPPAMAPPPPPA